MRGFIAFRLALLGTLILLAPAARATTYYISANGSDSNTGTSEGSPWLHAPGMPNCSVNCLNEQDGTGGYTAPSPGDNYIFRGGDSWSVGDPSSATYIGKTTGPYSCGLTYCGWDWIWSGSSGSPIYLGVDQTWFNSGVCGASWCRPILNGDSGTSTTLLAMCPYDLSNGPNGLLIGQPENGLTNSYVTVDNWEFTGFCSADNQPAIFSQSGRYNILENSYVHGWSEAGVTGIVNVSTSGNTITWVSGNQFLCNSQHPTIRINLNEGSPNEQDLTIATCSATSITTSTNPTANFTGATYKQGGDGGSMLGNYGVDVTYPSYDQYSHDVFDGSDTYCTGVHACEGYVLDGSPVGDVDHSIFRYVGGAIGATDTRDIHDNLFELMYESWDLDVHGDVLRQYGAPNPAGTPYWMYNNVLRNLTMGTPWVLTINGASPGGSIYFFNNVAFNSGNGGCVGFQMVDLVGNGTMAIYFANNTLDETSCGAIGAGINMGYTTGTINIFAQNNHMIAYTGPMSSIWQNSNSVTNFTLTDNGNEVYQSLAAAEAQGYTYSNNLQPTSTSGATYHAGGVISSPPCSTYSPDSALCSGSTSGATNTDGSGTIPTLFIPSPPTRGSAWDAGAYQFPPSASYSIVQTSSYGSGYTASLSSNETAGDTNIALSGFCPSSGCTSASCPAQSMSDGSNGSYTVDAGASVTGVVCVQIGHVSNIVATSSATTVNCASSGSYWNVCSAIEVSGLGTGPTVESTGYNQGTAITSVATGGSCSANDFAISMFYSGATPAVGSGWTAVGTPGGHYIIEWQTVNSSGTVTATVSGTSGVTGASVACYKPGTALYSIAQSSAYVSYSVDTASLTANQTAGNANIVFSGFCPGVGCVSTSCPTETMSDSPNGTYTVDVGTSVSGVVCAQIGHYANITSTSSTNTVNCSGSVQNYQICSAIEVNGLGSSPVVDSTGYNQGTAITSVATGGSCSVNDFAIAMFYSGNTPAAGTGWTAIGSPGAHYIIEWQIVASAGTVTATVSGTSGVTGGSVVCYAP